MKYLTLPFSKMQNKPLKNKTTQKKIKIKKMQFTNDSYKDNGIRATDGENS
jgi:hypothetical protein